MRSLVPVLALIPAMALAQTAQAQSGANPATLDSLPLITDIAPDAVAISPHVPQMGAHYAHPADLPTGPIWCVIDGRVVCVEYIFLAATLADGLSWNTLPTGGVSAAITHVDFDYVPDGVGPFQEPLYQLHIWFLDQNQLAEH